MLISIWQIMQFCQLKLNGLLNALQTIFVQTQLFILDFHVLNLAVASMFFSYYMNA